MAHHWDTIYAEGTASAWTSNRIVQNHVSQKMTDNSGKFWLDWACSDYLHSRGASARRVLSIGCGDGAHELLIARSGVAERIVGFDASKVGIEAATRKASELRYDCCEFYVMSFEEFCETETTEEFDVVLFSGSLHHVKDIESMLFKVRSLLSPSGYLIVNEYVGAMYNIYPNYQVDIVNNVAASIPDKYLIKPRLVNATIDMVYSSDPSESVRSSIIRNCLDIFFDAEWTRNFGGGLLHPIFTILNSNLINNESDEAQFIVRQLIFLEETLTSNNILPNDFFWGFFRQKARP